MALAHRYTTQSGFAALVSAAMIAGCASPAQNGAPVAAADSKPCKTTRNFQAPGPQPASYPPRCAGSVDAGKLPAAAIAPILVPH